MLARRFSARGHRQGTLLWPRRFFTHNRLAPWLLPRSLTMPPAPPPLREAMVYSIKSNTSLNKESSE